MPPVPSAIWKAAPRAEVWCVMPPDAAGTIGFGIKVDGAILRFNLSNEHAIWLGGGLTDSARRFHAPGGEAGTNVQSDKSSDSPHSDVSSSVDVEKVEPPASSCAAACGVKYLPRSSSRHMAAYFSPSGVLRGTMRNRPQRVRASQWPGFLIGALQRLRRWGVSGCEATANRLASIFSTSAGIARKTHANGAQP